MGLSIVVLQNDPVVAQSLAGSLRPHFHCIHLTQSSDELRDKVAHTRPEAVVLDIESSRFSDLELLHREYPALPIVCTHRIPDEEMWTAALNAGAADVCAADDADNVLTSVLRNLSLSGSAAA